MGGHRASCMASQLFGPGKVQYTLGAPRGAAQRAASSEQRENFAIFLFSAGGRVLEMYSFGIFRAFVAQYLEFRILVFLMETFSKKNTRERRGVKKKIDNNCPYII